MKILNRLILAAIVTTYSALLITNPVTAAQATQVVKVTSISVKGPTSALVPKQTFQLKAKVVTLPVERNVKIKYSSTATTIATVSANGLVTAVSPGKAVIYISSGGKTTYIVVHVNSNITSIPTGLWVEQENVTKAREILLTDGGNYFELKSYKNHILEGHYFLVSSAPNNRIADVEISNCKITNGIGTFSYEDDGWGNSGQGVVELKVDNIVFTFKETKSDEFAMWNLGTQSVTLYKSNAKSQ